MPTGTGLSLQQAIQILDKISASDADHQRFHADTEGFLQDLGIDPHAALSDCATISDAPLPPPDQLKAARDAMIGRLLTAHLGQTIHNVK